MDRSEQKEAAFLLGKEGAGSPVLCSSKHCGGGISRRNEGGQVIGKLGLLSGCIAEEVKVSVGVFPVFPEENLGA